MDIRKATEQDIDAILALNRQIGQLHFEQVPEVFCPPSPEDRAFLLGAIADEARLFCVAVVVDEGQRSRGIGRALIAHGDQWGKARGASQLRLEVMAFNERARALYERLGFKAQSQTMAR
ncbi:GNAT family N-acetyltransferase [Aeromonas caviae]|uniref:GNAT family N-acetyltransferase n=1 Tax=Aeromonas caviae TaxID=648 RepID=UPI0029D68AC6|nr:GNAT family N-acetyltransferase [Aeromonas caviae]MDX7760486.1 GNAT family N-acetyltransferase [Aeromonas caviae]